MATTPLEKAYLDCGLLLAIALFHSLFCAFDCISTSLGIQYRFSLAWTVFGLASANAS
jgi:hypothetical protein